MDKEVTGAASWVVVRCEQTTLMPYRKGAAQEIGESMEDLYKDAIKFGLEKARRRSDGGRQCGSRRDVQRRLHSVSGAGKAQIGRHGGGRRASDALLDEARKVGVTDAQWEALRAKAAEVAYD